MTDYLYEELLELSKTGKYQQLIERAPRSSIKEIWLVLDAFLQLDQVDMAQSLLNLWKDRITTINQEIMFYLFNGRILIENKEYTKAEESFLTALEKFKVEQDFELETRVKIRLGESLYYQKRFDEAQVLFEEQITNLEATGNLKVLEIALIDLGEVYYRSKDYIKALQIYNKALECCQKSGNKFLFERLNEKIQIINNILK